MVDTPQLPKEAPLLTTYSKSPSHDKWVLITKLYQEGGKVLLGVRILQKGLAAQQDILRLPSASGRVEVVECDLSRFSSITKCVEEIKDTGYELSGLICNAGVYIPPHDVSEQGWPITLAVNHFGHFLLTHLLVDNLARNAPSRIVTLGSIAETFCPADFVEMIHNKKGEREGWTVYGFTKMANIWMAKEYAMRLHKKGIDAFAVHPGIAKTPLAYDKVDRCKIEGKIQRSYVKGKRFGYFGPPYWGPAWLWAPMDWECSTTNPLANDEDACKTMYFETFKQVEKHAPEIKKHKLPPPSGAFPLT
eukprot:jgi/Astpho2/5374/Aster-05916